jgi:glycosyltransferase involved in cell wall biosynthesis
MRVLIDAREFVPGRLTGIGRLLINMLAPLVGAEDAPEFILAGVADCIPPELSALKCVPLPYRQTQLMDQIGLPKLAKQYDCDLIFIPYYKAPFFSKTPVIISVHDISFLRHATGHRGLKRWLVAAQLKASCRKATRIMTISEFSKSDLCDLWPVARKTDVIHLDFPTEWLERIAEIDPDKSPEPYYLYVGTFKRYKNVDELVRAWALLKQRGLLNGQKLMLVGGRGADLARIEALVTELEVADDVELPGFVSDDELFELYRNANWFITASGYEGFGLPPLEAMACGCPVMYHHATSMIEVLGGAAWPLARPDAAVVAQEVARTIGLDPAERRAFIEKGRERIQQFAPGHSAQRFLELLNRV